MCQLSRPSSDEFYKKFILPEEMRLLYPNCPAWNGGWRWFQSPNVVDLQDYRSPIEKERIRRVVLGICPLGSTSNL
jgi:hypothetical protein